jgi:hypothetical protein
MGVLADLPDQRAPISCRRPVIPLDPLLGVDPFL